MNPDNTLWKKDKNLLEEAYDTLYSNESQETCECDLEQSEAPTQTEEQLNENQMPVQVPPQPVQAAPAAPQPVEEPATSEGGEFTEDHITAAIEIAFTAAHQLAGGDVEEAFEMVNANVAQIGGALNEGLLDSDAGSTTPSGSDGEIDWKAKREDLKDPDVSPGSRSAAPKDPFVNPRGEHGGSGKSIDKFA